MPRRLTDPFPGFRFLLQLGAVPVAGFAECTGLKAETKVLEYVEGGRNGTTLKFPEATNHSNVTLRRGVTRSPALFAWHREVAAGRFRVNTRPLGPNIAVLLQDELGVPVQVWLLVRAMPVAWTGPDLKATASEVAIETLELAHEGIVAL